MKSLRCEGDQRSPDVQVLRCILRDLPIDIIPALSRGALLQETDGAAIRDGDYPTSLLDWTPDPTPRPWRAAEAWRGWMWRRKEIENYLLDPVVLSRTFAWQPERVARYEALLVELLDAVAERTAARMALVGLLPLFERRVVKPFDPILSGDALEDALRERHRRATYPTRFDEDALIARFRALRPLCMRGGPGYHPWVMAGKDLMGAIARVRGIRERFPELVVPDALMRAVVAALQADPSCAAWLPEWAGLRREVAAWAAA